MDTLSKNDLARLIAGETGFTIADSAKFLDALENVSVFALRAGKAISLRGFIKIEPSERAARTGRNPRTGAQIKIKAAKVPKFRPGKGLKDHLN